MTSGPETAVGPDERWGPALTAILQECLGVRPKENVLVVTDPSKRPIGEKLYRRALALGAEAVIVEMAERETHGSEPPAHVAAAMAVADVLLAPTTKSLSHTEARRAACAAGCRAATMPDITEEMLLRTMAADYGGIRTRSRAVAEALTGGSEVHITSPEGTDVYLDIRNREGLSDDGDLAEPGAFGNLPAGEGFIAPVEGGTNGRVVFDGTMWPVGRLRDPLTVEIESGYAISFSGSDAEAFEEHIKPHGRAAYAVAELGIGTNDRAQLTGNVLEDEKIMGTIHIAFGDNHTFGGTIRVASHQDGIVLHPTVSIDGTKVLEDGRLLL